MDAWLVREDILPIDVEASVSFGSFSVTKRLLYPATTQRVGGMRGGNSPPRLEPPTLRLGRTKQPNRNVGLT